MLQSVSILLAGRWLQRYEKMRRDPVWVPVIAGLAPPANGAKLQKFVKAHLEVVAEFKTNLARVDRSTTCFPLTLIRRLQACLSPLVRLQALQTSYFSTRDIVACVMLLFTCIATGLSHRYAGVHVAKNRVQ